MTSCGNDTQFSSRLSGGGTVTFSCGRKTIPLQSLKTIGQNTVIDGGGQITLSGGSSRQLFQVNGGVTLTLKTADPGPPAPSYQDVFLDWVGADCTTKYNVVVRYHSSTGRTYFSRKNLHDSSVTTTALATGYTWYWQVTACNAMGCVAGPWKKFRTTAE